MHLTGFIGRQQELASVQRLLQCNDVRLVVLTGPGGVGKTRLAVQAAAGLHTLFGDGICFVPLAPLRDASLVLPSVARALGLRADDVDEEDRASDQFRSVCECLQDRQVLLVLDNFEHVITAATSVHRLLIACPDLKVLVTSRATLHLSGEHEVPLLPLPAEEAKLLFAQRAQAADPEFALTPVNERAVTEICQRLDGLPLAVELTAARSRLLPPRAMLSRLRSATGQARLGLSTGGAQDLPDRHQTLRRTIAWSYDQLAPEDQAFFRRVAVFSGGCTLDAAVSVLNAPQDLAREEVVLEGLGNLLDQSLLQRSQGANGEPRFTMLESVREFAWEHLLASSEARIVQQRHAEYFLTLAERAEPELSGAQQITWINRLEQEHDNLRQVLRWYEAQHAAEERFRLAGALWRFWELRGHYDEGRRWLERLLGQDCHGGGVPSTRGMPHVAHVPAASYAKVLHGTGVMALSQGDRPPARTLLEQSLALYQQIGDRRAAAMVLSALGRLAWHEADYTQAHDLHRRSLILFRELGDKPGLAAALDNLGQIARARADYPSARVLFEESLALFREVEDRRGVAGSLYHLGAVALAKGDHDDARACYKESLRRSRSLGTKKWTARALGGLALLARVEGNYEEARALYEQSLILRRELGDKQAVAGALHQLGAVLRAQGNYAQARAVHEQGLALCRQLDDRQGIPGATQSLALLACQQGDYHRARDLANESLRLDRERDDQPNMAGSLDILGQVAQAQGDYSQAQSFYRESLALLQQANDHSRLAGAYLSLGRLAIDEGNALHAGEHLHLSLGLFDQLGIMWGRVECVEELACLACRLGRAARAARLMAWAEAVRTSYGTPLPPVRCAAWDQILMTVRASLRTPKSIGPEPALCGVWPSH